MNKTIEITHEKVEKVGNRYYCQINTSDGIEISPSGNLVKDTEKDCEEFAKITCLGPWLYDFFKHIKPWQLETEKQHIMYSSILRRIKKLENGK